MSDDTQTPADIERIVAALGSSVRVPFAPPHVYPMSAPAFTSDPEIDRPHPRGQRLGVYVHIPFCNYACSFCFYAKRVGDGREAMERYLRAAEREMQWIEPGTALAQLYVGGGTPTTLPAELLDRLLGGLLGRLRVDGSEVHTVECSPESITGEHLAVLARHGIGRVSMGIQSLEPAVLNGVNRRHGAAEALDIIDQIVGSGRIVNVDLIYGLPGQTEDTFRRDFELCAARGIHSVTTYNLRVNERTPVVSALATDEQLDVARLVRWRSFVRRTATALGFVTKTWQTFERPSRRASSFEDRTGLGDQIGIGLSARSRLADTVYRNHTALATYVERVEAGRSPVEEVFPLTEEARQIRFIAHSLGVAKPLSRAAYAQAFGRPFDEDFGESVARLRAAGLLDDDGDALGLSHTGRLVWDLVTLAFYPQRVQTWLGDKQAAAHGRRRRARGA